MKKLMLFIPILSLVLITSCDDTNSQSDSNTTQQQPIKETRLKDTAYYFVKRLLNASPHEVEKVLGKPDKKIKKSKDCGDLPYCDEGNYQNGNFDVLYFNNKLKYISINNVNGLQYNDGLVECLNFPATIPSVTNNLLTHWKNYEGIKLIGSFPKDNNPNEVNYILIEVDEKYDKKFEIIGAKEMDKANAINQKQEKIEAERLAERKKLIEQQFSSWNGSNKYVEKAIKKEMNDPDSYEHISTKYFDLGDHLKVVTEFRGANSFGAKVKNTVIAQVGLDGQILKIENVK